MHLGASHTEVTMSTNSPSGVRDQIVYGLRRSLVGPCDPVGMSWLGEQMPVKNVDDPGFEPEPGYPVGPWVDHAGNEVIDRDPRVVYSIGVLYPTVMGDPQALAPVVDDADDAGNPLATELPDDEGDSESDADSDTTFSHTRFSLPRSLGFTVQPADDVTAIEISISGAWYEPRQVKDQKLPWWARRAFTHTLTMPALDSTAQFSPDGSGIVLTVGTTRRLHRGHRMITIWVRNDTPSAPQIAISRFCVFQTQLQATVTGLQPLAREQFNRVTSLDLLYSKELMLATGHGCDVSVATESDGRAVVRTETLPVVELRSLTPDISDAVGVPYAVGMRDLSVFSSTAVSAVERLIEAYATWVSDLSTQAAAIDDPALKSVALTHVERCRQFLSEIRTGWAAATTNDDVRLCLTLASRAMDEQRRAYNSPERNLRTQHGDLYEVDGIDPHTVDAPQAFWRPFQLAFVLAMLPRFVARASHNEEPPKEDWVNVIWMPTGGGKTEAYLGLSAFVILWERLHRNRTGHTNHPSMKVFMRYTYRLLTVQQVSRAASMICALELIRRKSPAVFGDREIRIGAWLGSAVTPNWRKDAVQLYRSFYSEGKNRTTRNFLLVRCPWCGTRMLDNDNRPAGYKIVAAKNTERVLAFCPNRRCEFSLRDEPSPNGVLVTRGLPVLEVDEDIYLQPPDFVIGTIDKTARLPWSPQSQALFGLDHARDGDDPLKRRAPAPALFIQDELHLIAGPLGSINGAFEILIEEFCKQSGGRAPVYIAATATTRNFESQAQGLYRRPARLIPPPGISIDDSFFAQRDENTAGKTYVGICSTGSISGLDTQTAVLASLAYHAAVLGPQRLGLNTDPWWSNVVFFSSRRALGLLGAASNTSLGQRIKWLRKLSGRRSGDTQGNENPGGYADRRISRAPELTATSSDDINAVLDNLSVALPEDRVIDLCLATSMIEVGLDVPRLGLMTVIGQPKSASQYIQATGRVGRSTKAPGLVVAVFKATTPRDLAHYEGFSHWHRRMYASVESASVTPFTRAALERSLPSVMAALLQMLKPGSRVAPSLTMWQAAAERFLSHVMSNSPSNATHVTSVLSDLHQLASSPAAAAFDWSPFGGNNPPLMFSADDEIPVDRIDTPIWRVMNSMRSVDADSLVRLVANPTAPVGPIAKPLPATPPAAPTDGGDDF